MIRERRVKSSDLRGEGGAVKEQHSQPRAGHSSWGGGGLHKEGHKILVLLTRESEFYPGFCSELAIIQSRKVLIVLTWSNFVSKSFQN